MFDRLQLLVLPWLVMGAVEAYPSGGLAERMQAVGFIEDFVQRLDQIDKEMRMPGNEWRIGEMLMAVRTCVDHDYLSAAPAHHEPVAHTAGG